MRNDPALTQEIAAAAARLVVEDGMEYEAAKRKAARALARHGLQRTALPSNESVEEEVRDHLELFCAQTQPGELAALRQVAMEWMARLQAFRPHLSGAVWRGTATRRSAVNLDLYCDDPKSAQIALLNMNVPHDVDCVLEAGREVEVLSLASPCPALGEPASLQLWVRDFDDLRGALKPDAQGRSWRGDLRALRARLAEEAGPACSGEPPRAGSCPAPAQSLKAPS